MPQMDPVFLVFLFIFWFSCFLSLLSWSHFMKNSKAKSTPNFSFKAEKSIKWKW